MTEHERELILTRAVSLIQASGSLEQAACLIQQFVAKVDVERPCRYEPHCLIWGKCPRDPVCNA